MKRLLLPLLLAALLYTSGVRLPFFSDDIETQRFVQPRTLVELWTQVEVNGTYYRPLTNLLHRTIPLEAALWHAVMLWLFVVSVALMGALVRALRWGRGAALAAMLLYAAFPFHAQAVLWPASIVHVLLTTLVLLGCVGVLRGGRSRGWMAAGVVGGMLAPFAHETGVVTPVLLLFTLWLSWGTAGIAQRWRYAAAVIGLPAAAAVAYWLLRSHFVASDPLLIGGDAVAFNAAFLGQGLSLPLQIVLGALPGDALLRAGLALGGLLLLLLVMLGRTRALWALLAWIGVALAPALLLLHPNYVRYSERLLVIAAPAIVLLWVALGMRLPRRAAVLSALLLTAAGIWLASDTIRQHHLHADTLRPVIALAQQQPNASMMFLNLPSHTERVASPLPLWHASAGLLTDWIELRDFLWLNAGQREYPAVTYAHIDALAQPAPGLLTRFYGGTRPLADLPALAQQGALYTTDWTGAGWDVRRLAQPLEAVAGTVFDERVQLAAAAEVRQHQLVVTLDWQVTQPLAAPWTPFVHLLCGDSLAHTADGDPLANTFPLAAWRVGQALRETRVLPLLPGCDRVLIGLYDRATLERAQRADGTDALQVSVPG